MNRMLELMLSARLPVDSQVRQRFELPPAPVRTWPCTLLNWGTSEQKESCLTSNIEYIWWFQTGLRQAQLLLFLKPTLFSNRKKTWTWDVNQENHLTINDLAARRTETSIVHDFGPGIWTWTSGKQSYQMSIEEIWSNVLCLLFRASWLHDWLLLWGRT